MHAYGTLMGDLRQIPDRAREVESLGYRGGMTAEMNNDPFLPLTLAAEHTEALQLITGIAVAFARNPMTLAQTAHDLNSFSGGRFLLGLGSQIQPHITKRFNMPWSKPAARMREFILAMRAIWDTWYDGKPLDFRGEFYRHTLMTPMFTPTNTQHGRPRVMLAGVGPLMTEVAGEVADGFIAHGFTTPRYLKEVTIPALERGLATSGRTLEDFEIICPVMIVAGQDEQAYQAQRDSVSKQLAFYGSTPAYKPVLDVHGWGDLQPELNRMSKRGLWTEMGECITDEILEAFSVDVAPERVGETLKARYGEMIDGWMSTYNPGDRDAEIQLIESLR